MQDGVIIEKIILYLSRYWNLIELKALEPIKSSFA